MKSSERRLGLKFAKSIVDAKSSMQNLK